MKYYKPVLLVLMGVLMAIGGKAQQNEYLEAKRLYNAGDLPAAVSAFADLKDDEVFGAYARFYLGLSYFKAGSLEQANRSWRELLSYYPRWENTTEALYWLSVSSFEIGDFENGLQYLESYETATTSSSLSKQLIPNHLGESDYETIRSLQESNTWSRELARLLAAKILEQPFIDRDRALLDDLVRTHNLSSVPLAGGELENVFRSRYNVAVLLPFMFESLEDVGTVTRNKLVMDFYQGMLLA